MSNTVRNRAKEYFPTVLLTLLSIVQAIALELLWAHISDSPYLYELTFGALTGWIQVGATLLTVVLIWLVYASNVMRFRWVPSTADSIYPFAIGIIEFGLMSALGEHSIGMWLFTMGLCVGSMTWIAQLTMSKARFDPDNAEFFSGIPRATLSDFAPHLGFVGVMVVFSILGTNVPELRYLLHAGILIVVVFLTASFLSNRRFWSQAIEPSEETNL